MEQKIALISLKSLPIDTTLVNRAADQMPGNLTSSVTEVGIALPSDFQSSFTEINYPHENSIQLLSTQCLPLFRLAAEQ